jgi:hypothetical protein
VSRLGHSNTSENPEGIIDFLGFVSVASSYSDTGTYKIPSGKSNGGERGDYYDKVK